MRSSGRRLLGLALIAATMPARAATADLTALSLEQLMDLSVVGASKYEQKQAEVGAAVSIITRDEIRAFGWRTLAEALNSLPGMHITYDRQYTYLGARGFGLPGDYNTRMLLTINGNRSNDVVFDAALLGSEFPLDLGLIERIEFIPGPGGAVYGQNAMFGVINVITRSGVEGVELAGALQGPQRLRQGRASWGRRLDSGVDLLVSVSGLRARGEDRFTDFGAAGVSGVAAGLDGARDKEFFAQAVRGPWSLDIVYGNRRKDDPIASFLADPLVPGQHERDRNLHTQVRFQDSVADGTLHLSGRLFLSEQRFTGWYSYGTPFVSTGTSHWRGAEFQAVSTALAGHRLMFGLEHQDNARSDQGFLDVVAPANDIFIEGSGRRSGAYVQDEWRLADSLTATWGLRLDHTDRGNLKRSPRVAVIWQADPDTLLKALHGRAHREPTAFERDYADGVSQVANPALRGERIDTVELVADRRVGPDLRLRASAYQWHIRSLVTLGVDPLTGWAQYQSGHPVDARGFELSADRTWDGGARLRASLAFQNVHDAGGASLANAPHRLGRLNFSAPIRPAGLHLGYELQFDDRRRASDGSQLGGQTVSHLHLTARQWLPAWEVGLGIRNLFDKRYAHPGASRNWQRALEQDGRSLRLEALCRY